MFVHALCVVASGQLVYHAQGVACIAFARALYLERPSPGGIEYSYHAAGTLAMVCTCLVHPHGINTLYRAVSVYMGMHKTLETLETLALHVWTLALHSCIYLHCMV